MNADASLTVAIANRPGDTERAVRESLGRLALEDFKDKVVAIKPNDTTANLTTRRPARSRTRCERRSSS